MSLPKEPRQKMINLMYLVLTALLALNVSNEILHAFKVINKSISGSNESIEGKNKELYDQIQTNAAQAGHEKVIPYRDKAFAVRKSADSMYNYLQEWKNRIIVAADGADEEGNPKRDDNINIATDMLVEKKGGDTLRDRITEVRKFMLSQLDPKDTAELSRQISLKIDLPKKTEENPKQDWKAGFFHNVPTIAAVTMFAKFQNDVRNSEALIISKIFQEAHSTEVRFDAIKAIAVPKTSYVLTGQKVEAEILLAAYNKTLQPNVSTSSGHITTTKDGVADWEGVASGVGLQTVKGQVSLNVGDHTIQEPYEFTYVVGSTGASIQLDKMNVFYIGVPNPITVSAAGYSVEDISVSIPGAQITGEKGHYVVTVSTAGEVTAGINAKTPTGPKEVGNMKIRVKMIPDPVGEVGGKSGGGMSAATFRAQLGVVANLKNFDFDARFLVTSFQFAMLPKRGEYIGPYTVTGNLFASSTDVSKVKDRCKPGDRIFIEEIKAKGPDGRTRVLTPITLLLN
ncbi:MAG: gliding motility protein GldM [Flavipsychrobacter sp.]|nr:gliding motility protein GldM [Flavipsychrobacter sp.]